MEDKFQIYVIENNSPYTKNIIQPYLLNLLHEGKIFKYVYFHENISNNAIELFFDSNLLDVSTNEYIMISDGDLVIDKKEDMVNWLEEEMSIINNRNDAISCGINLALHNVPLYKGQRTKVPDTDGIIHDDCVEFDTGVHLLLIKRNIFNDFIKWRKETNSRFIDESLRHYFKAVINKKWLVTKFNHAHHLTWDLYHLPDHPYTVFKNKNDFYRIWKHNDYCFFTVYENGRQINKYPYKAYRTKLKNFYWYFNKHILHRTPVIYKFEDVKS